MSNIIKNFETAKTAIQQHLGEYLQEHGIHPVKGKILCLNKEHNDSVPSMSYHTDGMQRLFCHACGTFADIFIAAHFLEGKPKAGPGWMTENFLYLANKYGIPVELNELTEEQQALNQVYRALSDIAAIIAFSPYGVEVQAEIKKRGWDPDFCRKHQIGSIISRETFKKTLTDLYSENFLKEIDVLEPLDGSLRPLFSPSNLIFVIKDEFGRPVGFAARDLLWKPGGAGTKYINSKTTGLRFNVYEKERRLYGLDYYLSTRKDENEPLYIFEGYADWATAVFHGVRNCVAIGGTSFGDRHIRELLRLNVRNVILALDGDDAGQKKAKELLDDKLIDVKGLGIRVITLPGDEDPDSYIRSKGIEAFFNLEKFDAFHWRMMQVDDRTDLVQVCKDLIPFIVNESSHLVREAMSKDLARFTGISLKTIDREIERLSVQKDRDVEIQRESIVQDIIRQLKRDPESAESILTMGTQDLKNTCTIVPENIFSAESYANDLAIQKLKEEQTDKSLGFKLQYLSSFAESMTGDWQQDVVLVFAGKSNHGKSCFVSQMALELAENNDNVICLFHTIDDTGPQLSSRFIAQIATRYADSRMSVSINKMKNPLFYIKDVNHGGEHAGLQEVRDKAYAHLQSLVRRNKLIVKDQMAGRTLAFAEALVSYYKQKFPDHQVIFFLDNFHKLEDFRNEKDERIRFKKMINYLKNGIAVKYHIPCICTMEYTKLPPKMRPSVESISESVALQYDVNGIFHIYNELSDYQGCSDEQRCPTFFTRDDGKKGAVLELIFGKNKVTEFKGTLYFKFFAEKSLLLPVRREVVEEWREEIRANRPPTQIVEEAVVAPTGDGGAIWKNPHSWEDPLPEPETKDAV